MSRRLRIDLYSTRAIASAERANRRNQDHDDRERHRRPHRVNERLGEHRMRDQLDLVSDLGGNARGYGHAGASLTTSDLEACIGRLAESIDEWPLRLGG